MEIKYQFFVEEKIFIQKFIGVFSIPKYIEYISHVMVKAPISFSDVDFIIIDYRDTIFEAPKREQTMDKLINLRKGIDKKNRKKDSVQHLFLIDENVPKEFFNMIASKMEMTHFETYTNSKDIDKSLSKVCDFGKVENIIKNLKNDYDA